MQKAEIVKIGFVDDEDIPQEWGFHCLGTVPALCIDEAGRLLYGGYTVDELRTIAGQ